MKILQKMNRREFVLLVSMTGLVGGFKPLSVFVRSYLDTTSWDPFVDMWLPDYKADDDALHQKYTGVSNRIVKKNLERLVAEKAKPEVCCLVVPKRKDGADIRNRHRYLNSLGITDKQFVDLEHHDYARSKYLALGMKDAMP